MHFAPPTAGLDLPCVVMNFMAIPAVTANPHTRYRTCPYGKFGFENVWLNVNYMCCGSL